MTTRYLACVAVPGGCVVLSVHLTIEAATGAATGPGAFVGRRDGERIVRL